MLALKCLGAETESPGRGQWDGADFSISTNYATKTAGRIQFFTWTQYYATIKPGEKASLFELLAAAAILLMGRHFE